MTKRILVVEDQDGTVARFAGDGVLILFDDPLPCPDPRLRAIRMAVEMREAVKALPVEVHHQAAQT